MFFFLKLKPLKADNLVPNSGFCFFKNASTSGNEIVKRKLNKNERLVIDTGTNDILILILCDIPAQLQQIL